MYTATTACVGLLQRGRTSNLFVVLQSPSPLAVGGLVAVRGRARLRSKGVGDERMIMPCAGEP
jgi:hypothetical protein